MSTDQLYVLAAILVAGGVTLFAAGLGKRLKRRAVERRLRACVAQALTAPEVVARRPGSTTQRSVSPLVQAIQRLLMRTAYGAMVQARLVRTGTARKAWEIVLVQVCLVVLSVVLTLILGPVDPISRLLTVAFLGAVGAAVPLLWLGRSVASRLATFERQLPEAIEAMAATLQAGSSLQQSMAILAREMPPPVSVEFQRVLRDVELGLSFPDSLAELSERVASADLVIFTSAVSTQQRIGGDLAHFFRVISHTIRERLRIRGETRVLTSQGRYSAYVVGGLPVALFAFLWLTNYDYLSGLLQPGLPRLLLTIGIVGIVLGFYLMNRIATVEV
jgi:tight adherence protein B